MHTCNATTVDQLLSLRDGEPMEAYVAQHVNTCASCSRELERLRRVQMAMQGLPTLSAPAYATVLPAQSPSNRAPASANRYRYTSIAAAATGVSVIALLIAFASHPEREHAHLHSETLAMTATPVVSDPMTSDPMASDPMASDMPPAIATLVVRSQDLESKLRRMPSRPIVERAGTTTIIDSLQTSIQWVDYKLSLASDAGLSEQQAAQLWRDRIQLMDSLVKVRYAETQRVAVL